jgi:hypothetical protein
MRLVKIGKGIFPNTYNGPQKHGETPINSIYRALDKLIIVPVLLYVAATSGTAAKIVVLEIGARKLQKERSATMTTFREFGSRS